MKLENTGDFKKAFLLYWFVANAIGLAFGWVIGEWLGLQIAEVVDWNVGAIAGFVFFEASIWIYRWAVLSRIKSYGIFKFIDAFLWIMTESIIWLGMQIGSSSPPSYRSDSLFGIISTPLLAYSIGVIGWLILWLIKVQSRKSRTTQNIGKSIGESVRRIITSLLVFAFFTMNMPIAITAGEAVAYISSWAVGRAVAGFVLGGLQSLLTGAAMLQLFHEPVWDD